MINHIESFSVVVQRVCKVSCLMRWVGTCNSYFHRFYVTKNLYHQTKLDVYNLLVTLSCGLKSHFIFFCLFHLYFYPHSSSPLRTGGLDHSKFDRIPSACQLRDVAVKVTWKFLDQLKYNVTVLPFWFKSFCKF